MKVQPIIKRWDHVVIHASGAMQKGRVAWFVLWQEPALTILYCTRFSVESATVEPIPVLGKEITVSPSLHVAQKRGLCNAGVK